MIKRLPIDAYLHVVQQLVFWGFDVQVKQVRYQQEVSDWVTVSAPAATAAAWEDAMNMSIRPRMVSRQGVVDRIQQSGYLDTGLPVNE